MKTFVTCSFGGSIKFVLLLATFFDPWADRQVAADEYASAQELKQQAMSAAAASDAESIPQLSPPVLGPEDQGKTICWFVH